MEKKNQNCPNCGAQVNYSNSRELKCSYCGSSFVNPLYEGKAIKREAEEKPIKQGIKERQFEIPFISSGDDIKMALYDSFVTNDEVPVDIFDKLKIVSLKRYYLPMFCFSGRYDAPWSCTKVIRRKDNQGNEYKDYQQASGLTRGKFNKLVLASYSRELPSDLLKYARVLSYTPDLNASKKTSTQSVSSHIKTVSQDRSRDECWNDDIFHKNIDSTARTAAWEDAIGWQAENFNCSTSFVCDRSELINIPIWYGIYSYKGKEYYFAMDDKLGNIDYSFSRDNTDAKRQTRAWLRFLFTVVVLVGITIYTECFPAFVFSIIAAIFYFIRCAYEYSESSKDLSSRKKIGKAKLCKEKIPETSSKYSRYKRTNILIMWALIAVVAIWGFGSMPLREQKERNEQARIAQEQFQIQQEEERLQKEVNEKREVQNKRKEAVFDMIAPKNLLKVNSNGSYQLRENLAEALLKLGFEKDDSDDGGVPVIGVMTKYEFNVDCISDDGSVSVQSYISAYIHKNQSSRDELEKSESISFLSSEYGVFKGIITRFIQQLKQDGFKVTKDLQIGDNISYICSKETDFQLENNEEITIMKNKISFKLKDSEISVSVSQEPF